jgi:putative transcriptional regulator
MTDERTELGHEVETALGEVLAHVRGEVSLPTRLLDDPSRGRILALRRKLGLSRRKFAERFHLDARTVQEWEQGRRMPDQAARILLTIIEREPEAVMRALSEAPPERKSVLSARKSRNPIKHMAGRGTRPWQNR